MTRRRRVWWGIGLTLCLWSGACQTGHEAEARVAQRLAGLGHRNWIVVVDSAYPEQTSGGIETVLCDDEQLEVVEDVLAQVDAAAHVRPVIFVDAELAHVPEADAPGITAYRRGLDALLAGRPVQRRPHEQIIADLDEAGKTFSVLALKTDLTLPYTSVFIRLDCAYWTDEAEARLRRALQAETAP